MSDRELLQLAAKAGGVVGEYECWAGQGFIEGIRQVLNGAKCYRLWNPLTDDGDALRLAATLRLTVGDDAQSVKSMAFAYKPHTRDGLRCYEPSQDDPSAAYRRAIVRAAAKDEGEAG